MARRGLAGSKSRDARPSADQARRKAPAAGGNSRRLSLRRPVHQGQASPAPGLLHGLGAWTAALACVSVAAPSARAQDAPPLPIEDRAQAVECLTLAIAYEAGFEPVEGRQAVAEVILNRVRHPAFPKSVCDVVFAGSTRRTGCQFTFTCDGALRRRLPDNVLAQARAIAEQAIDGQLPPLVGDATNYHADYVSPYWAPALERVTKIGLHIFYRRPGAVAPGGSAIVAAGGSPGGTAPPKSAPAEPFAPWGLTPMAAPPPPGAHPGS